MIKNSIKTRGCTVKVAFLLALSIFAEDKKVHLKAKNKEMCDHLRMQIRCQFKILFGDKFFKQFLKTFTYNA